jgi:riboflavin kinase
MDEKFSFALRKIALLGGIYDYVAVSSRELGEALGMSQQSASKRILELLDEKFLVRDLGARRQRIKITEAGIEEMRKEYNEYRRIFELTDHVTLRGKVVTGMGEGGYYVTQKPYMDQFQVKLNFRPYEGTLNVRVIKEDLGKLEIIRNMPGHLMDGFEKDGRTFGKVIAYKAKLRNIDCAIVVPERSHYEDMLELVCQFHLRRTLSITDGDDVDVIVDLSPLSPENQITCVT